MKVFGYLFFPGFLFFSLVARSVAMFDLAQMFNAGFGSIIKRRSSSSRWTSRVLVSFEGLLVGFVMLQAVGQRSNCKDPSF
jgi:hypothetical protein